MSEAPKKCDGCTIRSGCRFSDIRSTDAGVYVDVPSSECPFVRLDAKAGEILVLKNQLLKATREATELRELLDEHGIELDQEKD